MTIQEFMELYRQNLPKNRISNYSVGVATNPEDRQKLDQLLGGAIFGKPISEVAQTGYRTITDPIGEYKRRESEWQSMTPEQKDAIRQENIMSMAIGATFGGPKSKGFPKAQSEGKTFGNIVNKQELLNPQKVDIPKLRQVIESRGGRYLGIQPVYGREYLTFAEPKIGSTLMIPMEQASEANVIARLEGKQIPALSLQEEYDILKQRSSEIIDDLIQMEKDGTDKTKPQIFIKKVFKAIILNEDKEKLLKQILKQAKIAPFEKMISSLKKPK